MISYSSLKVSTDRVLSSGHCYVTVQKAGTLFSGGVSEVLIKLSAAEARDLAHYLITCSEMAEALEDDDDKVTDEVTGDIPIHSTSEYRKHFSR